MKYLLLGTALGAGGLGAAWYGGETWLSGKAREAVANSPAVEAASVAPLRDPRRIGLHLAEVEVGDDRNGFSAPGLDVYAPLTAPTTMTALSQRRSRRCPWRPGERSVQTPARPDRTR